MNWKELLNYDPLPHQIEGFDYALKHHYSINGFTMGYGKTLIGIMLSLKTNKNTLIVCPAFLKRNWESEYRIFSKRKVKVRVLFSKELKKFKPTDEEVIVINYELINKCEHLFRWADLIIGDESHYLANPTAQRTMAFAEYVELHRPDRLLLLSGSPIRGKVPQWFAPIYITSLNPKKTSGIDIRKTPTQTYWNFQKFYCNAIEMRIGSRNITKFEGVRNVERLKNLLRDKYVRKVPSFKLKLPNIFPKYIKVDYDNADEALQEAWAEYEAGKKISDHVSSAKKSSALSKVPFTFAYVKNIIDGGEGPVVVYSDHVDSVRNISDTLEAKGYESRFITGAVDTEIRQGYVDKFQEGKLDALCLTIGAGSTGITLTAANNLVFNDLSWINTENHQAEKRIHRIGQDKDCVIHYIVGSNVDKLIAKTVTAKDDVMEKTVEI